MRRDSAILSDPAGPRPRSDALISEWLQGFGGTPMSDLEDALPPGFDWKALTPDDSPKGLPDVLADPVHQDLSTAKLVTGDPAHDFALPLCDFSTGVERETGETFHLVQAAAERPVALIFGSYT
jgi:hypothetical protein